MSRKKKVGLPEPKKPSPWAFCQTPKVIVILSSEFYSCLIIQMNCILLYFG